jgi:hypothetical protein
LFNCWATNFVGEHQSTVSRAKENGHFLLTTRGGEAYIHDIGAPSDNGAIARL